MKLDDVGDPALVERVARIVYEAFPPEEMPFDEWMVQCRTDEQGAFQFSLFALDVLDEKDISIEAQSDIARFNQLVSLALDIMELQSAAYAN